MILDGIFSSECTDSAAESASIEGMDVSDWEKGLILCNWEHEPGEKGASTIVGRVVYCKKIFKEEDAENDRQKKYWETVKCPILYGIVQLFDTAGHKEAQAIAAIVRDCVKNGIPPICKYSVEGVTLSAKDGKLLKTVIKRVAITCRPANRTAISGLVKDDDAPPGFDKEPEVKEKDVLDGIIEREALKSEVPTNFIRPLGQSVETNINPWIKEDLIKSLLKEKLKAHLAKTTTAGSYDVAPSALTGGAALQVEDRNRHLVATCKAIIRDYKPGKGSFREFAKAHFPEVSDQFLDHFEQVAHNLKVKGMKKTEISLSPTVLKLEKLMVDLGHHIALFKATVPGRRNIKVRPPVDPNADTQEGPALSSFPSNKSIPQPVLHPVVDANKHGNPPFNTTSEQHALIHGLDLSDSNQVEKPSITDSLTKPKVYNHPTLGKVVVKGDWHDPKRPNVKIDRVPEREVSVHNLARDFFGMGHFVPTTAFVVHPQNGERLSVQQMIPGAEHHWENMEMSKQGKQGPNEPHQDYVQRERAFNKQKDLAESKQREILEDHENNGDLHKLHLMNLILGNGDRHSGNFMYTDDGKMHMIDHNLMYTGYGKEHVARVSNPNKQAVEPAYTRIHQNNQLQMGEEDPLNDSLHPEAHKWLMSLDENKLAHLMGANGMMLRQSWIDAATHHLKLLKNAALANPGISRYDLHRLNRGYHEVF